MELRIADLAKKSDDVRYPYESNGVKTVAAPIQLEGRSFKGTLHYTAEFIPCLALKNIKFETQTTEKDRVASRYDDERGSIGSTVSGNDDIPTKATQKPDQPTPSPNDHPVQTSPAAVDAKPNETGESNETGERNGAATDEKAEGEGVEMSHEDLLAQR